MLGSIQLANDAFAAVLANGRHRSSDQQQNGGIKLEPQLALDEDLSVKMEAVE
jgi:hypothetical protein